MTAPTDKNGPQPEPQVQPRRPFFARLAAAVRRQDWFVVALEVAIVVLGVIIGFQVTAWGQARSDAAKERTYLHQLAADLAETERIVADRDARMDAQTHVGLGRLLGSFDHPERPPADSVEAWLRRSMYVAAPLPILGTAEALVASGDLGLIADDSLRASVLRYLDVTRESVIDQRAAWDQAYRFMMPVFRDHVDVRIVGHETSSAPTADSLVLRVLDAVPELSPPESWRPPFPIDVDALYAEPSFYRSLGVAALWVGEAARARRTMRESATALRRQIEREVGE